MSLDSSSTYAEIEAAYLDNAGYDEEGSTAKAKAFVVACRLLMLVWPKRADHGDTRLETSIEQIQAELTAAQRWLATHPTDGAAARVKHVDFRNYRQ